MRRPAIIVGLTLGAASLVFVSGGFLAYRNAEAGRARAEIATTCARIPELSEAINWTVETRPYTSFNPPVNLTDRLFYFAGNVLRDGRWCETLANHDMPAQVANTLSWNFGNASQALREYQGLAQSQPPSSAPTAAPPQSTPTATAIPHPLHASLSRTVALLLKVA